MFGEREWSDMWGRDLSESIRAATRWLTVPLVVLPVLQVWSGLPLWVPLVQTLLTVPPVWMMRRMPVRLDDDQPEPSKTAPVEPAGTPADGPVAPVRPAAASAVDRERLRRVGDAVRRFTDTAGLSDTGLSGTVTFASGGAPCSGRIMSDGTRIMLTDDAGGFVCNLRRVDGTGNRNVRMIRLTDGAILTVNGLCRRLGVPLPERYE